MSEMQTWVRTDANGAITELYRSTRAPEGGGWMTVAAEHGSRLVQPGIARRHFVAPDGSVSERSRLRFVADRVSAPVGGEIRLKLDGATGPVRVLVAGRRAVIDGELAIIWDTATGVTVTMDESESRIHAHPIHLRWEAVP